MKQFSIFSSIAIALLFSINSFAQMTTVQGTVSNLPSGSPITVNALFLNNTGSINNFSTVTDSSGFYSFSSSDLDSLLQFPNNMFMVFLMQDCTGNPTHDTIFGTINLGSVEVMDLDYCPSIPTTCSASFTLNQTDPITQAFTPNQAWLVNGSTGSNLTYTWDFGDGTTSTGLNNLTHTYTGNGPYILCLSVDDGAGCMDTFCDTISVDSTGTITKMASGFSIHIGTGNLGTEEIETPSFMVYPNPVNDVLFLQLNVDVSNNAKYSLTDLNGRTIIHEQLKESAIQIDVSTLPAGTYMVKVEDQNNNLIQKITIE